MMETPESSLYSKKIELLPEHLIDQIKAGEVIERPSSLIKEILENSIDAGATKIDLHLVQNGLDLISLIDDGAGINFDDLPYAFCRHATSKISRFEDLYALNSFGFRGEALASIAAIAKVTCTSSPGDNAIHGGRIVFHGGEEKSHENLQNLPRGTALYIKDLFYNTPARLKFIKSATSEKNALKRIIDAFLISNSHVSFSIKWDEEDKSFFPKQDNLEDRVKNILIPRAKEKDLITFDEEYEGHRIRGFLTKNSTKGHAHKRQFLFANNRLFTDRQIHQTIVRGMEKLYPHGESGHYCIFIDVPENLIDVNVHPSKTQIKFFKLPVITALISSQMKKSAQEVNLVENQTNFFNQDNAPSAPRENQELSSPSPYYGSTHYRPRENYTSPVQINGQSLHQELRAHHKSYAPSNIDIQLLKEDDQLFLLSKKKFWFQVYEKLNQVRSTTGINDGDYIPQLISDPMNVPPVKDEKSALEELELYGFQCERLDESTLLLRSIHESFQFIDSPEEVAFGLISLITTRDEIVPRSQSLQFYQEAAKSLDLKQSQFMFEVDKDFYEHHFS